MLITSIKNLRDSLGEMDADDVNDMLESALLHTTSFLETSLETSFSRATITNIFRFTDTSTVRSGGYVKLKLSEGFIDSSETFEIYLAGSRELLDSADPVITTNLAVNYELGLVTILEDIAIDSWAKIVFTKGFTLDSRQILEAPVPPTWLTTVAIDYASVNYKQRQQLNSLVILNKGQKAVAVAAPQSVKHILDSKSRWSPTAFTPVLVTQ